MPLEAATNPQKKNTLISIMREERREFFIRYKEDSGLKVNNLVLLKFLLSIDRDL